MSWVYNPHHDDEHVRPEPSDPSAGAVSLIKTVGVLMLEGPKKYDPKILTDEVRLAISQVWEVMPLDALIKNHLSDIAYTLDEILTDALGYDNDKRYAIAEELVRYIRLMLESPAPAPVPSPAAATTAPAPSPTEPESDAAAEAAAKERLLKMAERERRIIAENAKTRQVVCRRIVVQSTNGSVDEVICLEGGEVFYNNSRVTLYCPFGVAVRQGSNNGQVKIKHRSYVDLLKIAQGYDL